MKPIEQFIDNINQSKAVYDIAIEQVGFVKVCSDGSPVICFWEFSEGDKSYTVEQLKDISDKYWADKTPPRLRLNELVDLAERRITNEKR